MSWVLQQLLCTLCTLIIVTEYPTQANLSGVATFNGLYSATDGAFVLSFTPPFRYMVELTLMVWFSSCFYWCILCYSATDGTLLFPSFPFILLGLTIMGQCFRLLSIVYTMLQLETFPFCSIVELT